MNFEGAHFLFLDFAEPAEASRAFDNSVLRTVACRIKRTHEAGRVAGKKSRAEAVVNCVLDVMKLFKADKLSAVELKVLGAKLRVGKFIQTIIRFLIMVMITAGISKVLKA